MRKLLICFVILINSLVFAVNGELTVEDDRKILRVWGTHSERGEAQGFLLAENIMVLFNEYAFNYTFSGNSVFYNQANEFAEANYVFSDRHLQEMQGIVDGMQDSGVDIYVPSLSREINLSDLKLINSIIDISALLSRNDDFQGEFGCSSLASWGSATQNDPDLNGELVLSRLLDWSTHPALIENSLMVIHEPSEEDEQKWLSFTYPSLIGGLTALNESGVFTELNMGNVSGNGNAPYSPVLLDVRSGIEEIDYNGDSISDSQDIFDAVNNSNKSNGFIIMLCDSEMETEPVRYIEVNASGLEVREQADNVGIQGDNIVSTNHFRKLTSPVYCNRYAALIEATTANSNFTIETNYSTLTSAAGHSGNMMAIQYIPSHDLIKWSNYHNNPAYQEPLVSYGISDLFSGIITDAQEESVSASKLKLKNYPNPFNPVTEISFNLKEAGYVTLEVYNIKGEMIKTLISDNLKADNHVVNWTGDDNKGSKVSSGIYFYKMQAEGLTETKKMILLK